MPGVLMEEAVSCENPLIWFGYQSGGQLRDVAALSFSIVDLVSGEERVESTEIDLTDYGEGGDRLDTGRYVPSFQPEAAEGWAAGTHEIRWQYVVEEGDPTKQSRQRFEVLETGKQFGTGAAYFGYGDTTALQNVPAFSCYALDQLHDALNEAGRMVDDLTGRTFSPRFISTLYNGLYQGALPLELPIIGISKVAIVGAETSDESGTVNLSDLRIYNRHLTGLTSPDDRDNPRIEFSTSYQPGRLVAQGSFEWGRQNTLIEGVFGYTDFDGTPFGQTPVRLQKAVMILALRVLQDPMGLDVFASQPGRIKSAQTRDQKVTFATAAEGGVGALTGDRTIDDILIPYMRPAQFHAVGPARIMRDTQYRGRL